MRKIYLVLLLLLSFTVSAENARWLRYSSISPDGKTVVFSYKGDIYSVSSEGGQARQLTSNPAYDYSPVWSPDGKKIAFASDRYGNHDIYIMSSEGGRPERLTTHSANDIPWTFTPDGKSIYYSSRMFDPAESVVFPKANMTELYSVSVHGGRPVQILATPAEEVSFVGKTGSFVYQDKKGGENVWRKHHTSSITRDIWMYDGKKHIKLTTFEGEDRTPRVSKDGKTVYFTSERDGDFNIYSFPVNAPDKVKAVTKHKKHPVRFLSISDNGTICYTYDGDIYVKNGTSAAKKLAVSVLSDNNDNDLITVSVTGGSDNALSKDGKQIAFVSRGEVFVTSTDYKTVKKITDTPEEEFDVSFSPSGKTLVYASAREGIWNIYTAKLVRKEDVSFPYATLIEEKALFSNNKTDKRAPKYSPDGKEIAYIDERCKLMVLNIKSGKTRQITDGSKWFNTTGRFSYSWSPDGKWFVVTICDNKNYPHADIAIVSSEGGKPVFNITESAYGESSPQWVLDGNAILYKSPLYGRKGHNTSGKMQQDAMLVFLNRKSYEYFNMSKEEKELQKQIDKITGDDETGKKTVEIEFEGISDRVVRLTSSSSEMGSLTLNKDGSTLYYVARYQSGMKLWRKKKGVVPIAVGSASGSLVWDSKKKNPTLYVLGSNFYKVSKDGKDLSKIDVSTSMLVDRSAEREAIFDEVYRGIKNRFYEKNLHGVDWDMYTAEYQRFLPYINNNYDFVELLSEYLGELNVSHTGASYGGAPRSVVTRTASLGLFFDLDYQGDGLKVSEVVSGGPFDKSNCTLEAGDIITAIDGNIILKNTDYFPYLDRKAGSRVLVDIRKSSGETVQYVATPITASKFSDLLYDRWVKANAEKVEKLSKGRLGYVHIKGMNDPSYRKIFSEALGKYNDCEGIVIDTRFNGGGHLQEDVEVLFTGHNYFTRVIRGKEASDMPRFRFNGPSVMLIGEANYSNAHGTPWVYKNRKIGTLIGMPVPGTMTSVNWMRSLDNSIRYGIPIVGYRDETGKYLENQQLYPDIQVENSKELVVKGVDQQLEMAVKTLLKQISGSK